jgi:hypothetical protein
VLRVHVCVCAQVCVCTGVVQVRQEGE